MVSRVSVYAIWMGGAGMGCQWLAGQGLSMIMGK